MSTSNTWRVRHAVHLIVCLASAAALKVPAALAEDSTGPNPSQTRDGAVAIEEIVVVGVRKSLQDEANAKRQAVNFSDSVYAEDIGKFPDADIAESLNRVPGVQLTRDINDQGVQVSVRGLGPSFTKVTLNGAQIAVASDGTTDAGNSNREVDLDLFPTELFSKLTVDKTPSAHLLEGGIAGTVDMANVRPFDSPGRHLTLSAQEDYSDSLHGYSPRASLIASNTWDTFGALVGVVVTPDRYRTDGYETVGSTTPKISCTGCNSTGGGGFSFANTVPANAGNGLTPGAPVDLQATSGLTEQQLSDAIFPRLGRESFNEGERKTVATLVALQYRPADNLSVNLDALYATANRNFNRLDMDWVVRGSNSMVPLDVQVDQNNVVTHAVLANSQFFLEARPYREYVTFENLHPNLNWKINDFVKVDGSFDYNESHFYRSDNTYLIQTPLNSGLTVTYDNPAGAAYPTISPSVNLADPNIGWQWNSIRVQPARRHTKDEGTHWDVTLGDESKLNVKVGAAYDNTARSIWAMDNSAAVNAAGQAAVPSATLGNYLVSGPGSGFFGLAGGQPGFTSFVVPNYATLNAATQIGSYEANAPFFPSTATATPSGYIDEKTFGAYLELNDTRDLFGHGFRYNIGIRVPRTDQTIASPIVSGGSVVPGQTQSLDTHYSAVLPSLNTAFDVTDDIIVRLALSKSMTRANPNQLLPGLTFSDPSAQVANAGNPNLRPYYSKNIDLGGEWYTGGAGFVGVDLFRKSVTDFTKTSTVQEPFSQLGYPDTVPPLSVPQQQAIANAGGPTAATVLVNTQVNSTAALHITGAELTFQQPLDFLWRGLGVTANYTHLAQSSIDPGTLATGISPRNYNLGGYFEAYGLSVHVTYVRQDGFIAANAPQNNLQLPLRADPFGQVDLSTSYWLPFNGGHTVQVSFNARNLTNAVLRETFGYEAQTFNAYWPGRQYVLGLRASF